MGLLFCVLHDRMVDMYVCFHFKGIHTAQVQMKGIRKRKSSGVCICKLLAFRQAEEASFICPNFRRVAIYKNLVLRVFT